MNDDNLRKTSTGWWKGLALIVAVSIPFSFLGLGSISFLDPNEGMYGAVAREMAQSGDWITPHFNSVPYLHKPPLYFWLTGLTTAIFGPSEWAVRLWTALPCLGIAVLLWRLGDLIYGRSAGLLSAMIFVSSVGVFRYVRVAFTEFLLVFSITLAIYGFVHAYMSIINNQRAVGLQPPGLQASRRFGLLVFWLGMALGVLTKGLIGVLFPLLIIGLFLVLTKARGQNSSVDGQWGWRRTLNDIRLTIYAPMGVLLFLVLVLPWHALAAWNNPGFFNFYVVDNQILRFFNRRAFIEDDISLGTFSFLLLTLVWFFPWSLFLPASFRHGFPRVSSAATFPEGLRSLIGLWAVVVLVFFSVSFSKLEHYSLSTIPPLSLMVGGLWGEAVRSMTNRESSIGNGPSGIKWSVVVGGIGCIAFGFGLLIFSDFLTSQALMTGLAELSGYYRILKGNGVALPFASVSPFVDLLKMLGIALSVSVPLCWFLYRSRRLRASFAVVLCLAGAIGLLVFRLLLVVEPHHSSRYVAHALASLSGPGDAIVHLGSMEYSGGLPFYTGREIYLLNGNRGSLDFGSRYADAARLFLDNSQFAKLWKGQQRVFLVSRFHANRDDIEEILEDKMFLVGQYGSRWLHTNRPIGDQMMSDAS